MKLTFVSNYINHHQIPVSNELYRQLGENYRFIQTEPMEEERVKMGWQDGTGKLPYLMQYAECPEDCRRLIEGSDVVVFGGTDEECYIQERLRAGRPILRYSERIYKSGQWKAVSPRGLRRKYLDHTRYRKSPVYLLCSGGYVASDFHLVRAYPGKMLKWGYFPETKHYDDVESLLKKHEERNVSLMWAGRFLDWKHPEMPVLLAEYLKKKGYEFHLSIAGGGEMEEEIHRMVSEKGLEDVITLCGYLKPFQIREVMEKTSVYLFTSDYKEGWGAVLNEAMNSGCAVLASHAIGAAPFLIEHGKSGCIYESGNFQDMAVKAEKLMTDMSYRKRLGKGAYEKIITEWNAENAADRLLKIAEAVCAGTADGSGKTVKDGQVPAIDISGIYVDGPCSRAEIISPGKMYRYLMKREAGAESR